VTVYAANNAPPTQFTLHCNPAGGTVPNPAAACSQLLADPGLFGPPPAHVMCPMIMANAGRFVVSGTYLGKPVNETVFDGGCDIPHWVELNQIIR
jgi:hypothetical protein